MIKNDVQTINNTLRQNGNELKLIANQITSGEYETEEQVLAAYEAACNAIENCDNFYNYITAHINTPEMLIVASEDSTGMTDTLLSNILQVRAQADILANVMENTYGITAADAEDEEDEEEEIDDEDDDGEDIEGEDNDLEADDEEGDDIEADEDDFDFDVDADDEEDGEDLEADEDFDLYADDEDFELEEDEDEDDHVPAMTGVQRNSVSASQMRGIQRKQSKDMRFNSVTAGQRGGRQEAPQQLFDFIRNK